MIIIEIIIYVSINIYKIIKPAWAGQPSSNKEIAKKKLNNSQ